MTGQDRDLLVIIPFLFSKNFLCPLSATTLLPFIYHPPMFSSILAPNTYFFVIFPFLSLARVSIYTSHAIAYFLFAAEFKN